MCKRNRRAGLTAQPGRSSRGSLVLLKGRGVLVERFLEERKGHLADRRIVDTGNLPVAFDIHASLIAHRRVGLRELCPLGGTCDRLDLVAAGWVHREAPGLPMRALPVCVQHLHLLDDHVPFFAQDFRGGNRPVLVQSGSVVSNILPDFLQRRVEHTFVSDVDHVSILPSVFLPRPYRIVKATPYETGLVGVLRPLTAPCEQRADPETTASATKGLWRIPRFSPRATTRGHRPDSREYEEARRRFAWTA